MGKYDSFLDAPVDKFGAFLDADSSMPVAGADLAPNPAISVFSAIPDERTGVDRLAAAGAGVADAARACPYSFSRRFIGLGLVCWLAL